MVVTSHKFWLVVLSDAHFDWLVKNIAYQENLYQSRSKQTALYISFIKFCCIIFEKYVMKAIEDRRI